MINLYRVYIIQYVYIICFVVLWLHEKKAVEASQNVIIKDSHDVHTLEIKKVSHQVHSGSYTAKLIGGSGTSEEEEVLSSCKVFILSKPPAEQKTVMTEENIQDKDIIPVVERQISTDQEELKLQIPARYTFNYKLPSDVYSVLALFFKCIYFLLILISVLIFKKFARKVNQTRTKCTFQWFPQQGSNVSHLNTLIIS